MSTRANIIVQETNFYEGKSHTERLFFYRHSDGYPEGAGPLLKKALEGLKSGNLRNNVSQFAGWLILLGAIEYNTVPAYEKEKPLPMSNLIYGKVETIQFNQDSPGTDWKVGSIEPTTEIHGDIEYLYVIDLTSKTVKYGNIGYSELQTVLERNTPVDKIIKKYVTTSL